MDRRLSRRGISPLLLMMVVACSLGGRHALAQRGPAAADSAPTAQQMAPQDYTGYWVSVVTEDWRYRMITPPKGDFAGVPLNAEGRRLAAAWDPAKDTANHEQCKAYGAAAIMRNPERIHIVWDDPETMRLQTDDGMQTRVFHFAGAPKLHETSSWQGYSSASWQGLRPGQSFGLGARAAAGLQPEGYLKVVTTGMRSGYLRKNGVPYSKDAKAEEYFDSFTEPDGNVWLSVTTIVTDPVYLQRPFIVSSIFKKQHDSSGWDPEPCEAQ